jgi:hypothetical protein
MTLESGSPTLASQDNWNGFSSRHANHEFLAIDPLLSVDEALMERFKASMPAVVTGLDDRFEADLREATHLGFCFKNGLPKRSAAFWQRHDNTSQRIRDMLKEEWLLDGHSESTITEHFVAESNRSAAVEMVQDAYCGWLLFNPEYQLDLAALKMQSRLVEELGGFPSLLELPVLGSQKSTHSKTPSNEYERLLPRGVEQEGLLNRVSSLSPETGEIFLTRLRNFYEKWELAKLVHWDIPLPQSPAYRVPIIYSEQELHPKGVTFSFPWFLVRSQRLTLSEMISVEIEFAAPPHLTEWLKLLHSNKGQPVPSTYQRLAELHRLFYLTLFPRYGARPGFTKTKAEQVFAEHLKTNVETIRKDLQKLGRMLRNTTKSSS